MFKVDDKVKKTERATYWKIGTVIEAPEGMTRVRVLWTEEWYVPCKVTQNGKRKLVYTPTGEPAYSRPLNIRTWMAVNSMERA